MSFLVFDDFLIIPAFTFLSVRLLFSHSFSQSCVLVCKSFKLFPPSKLSLFRHAIKKTISIFYLIFSTHHSFFFIYFPKCIILYQLCSPPSEPGTAFRSGLRTGAALPFTPTSMWSWKWWTAIISLRSGSSKSTVRFMLKRMPRKEK